MLLMELNKDKGWLFSDWKLAYPVGWEQICKAVAAVYPSFSNPELLVNNKPVKVESRDDVMALDEAENLMIRGGSNILRVPVMITFFNQTNIAKVVVAQATDEFKHTDYQKFNMSMCQFLDSIEIAMHR